MENGESFALLIKSKKIPILVLDQKWHRLFAIHGKTDEIRQTEEQLKGFLARQGKANTELKELKKLKGQLMDSIVQNMDDREAAGAKRREKKMEETKRLIDEINEKMENYEDELLMLPKEIKDANDKLMLYSMDYFHEKLKINTEESREIEEWINKIRVELKKNIVRKQNRDINNKEIYTYLHDVFGPEVLDLFDYQYTQDEDPGEGQGNPT